MPRNGSGTYSLPQSPFVPGTQISSAAVNSDFSDIANALTASIAADGQTPFTGPMRFSSGTVTVPSISFAGSTGTGFFLNGVSQIGWAAAGVLGATFNSDLSVDWAGNATWAGTASFGTTLHAVGAVTFDAALTIGTTLAVTGVVTQNSTSHEKLPAGTTLQRPGSPVAASFRFNTDTGAPEFYDGSGWRVFNPWTTPRGYIDGLILSRSAATTLGVSAGIARSDDNSVDIALTSAFTKTFSAWVAGTGNGGLDTGAIPAANWLYVYVIYNPTTGASDVIFTTTFGGPTLPSGFTKKRYIGAFKTSASQMIPFIQYGNEFYWLSPLLDFSSGTSTSVTVPIAVPTSVNVKAFLNVEIFKGGTNAMVYITSPDVTDVGANQDLAPLNSAAFSLTTNTATVTAQRNTVQVQCWAAGGNVRVNSVNGATNNTYIVTLGWFDYRGSNA